MTLAATLPVRLSLMPTTAVFPSGHRSCSLRVDGEAARVEADVLRLCLLPLQIFAQAVQERQLLGGIEAFQPALLDDLLQALAQRLVEGRVLLDADVYLVADGVLHLAGLGLVALERLDFLVELRREQLDLLDQDLDAVRNDGVGDELPHLLSAAGQVEAVVPVAGAGGPPDLAQPAQVGVILQGALVRQQHVHRLAEAAEGEVELGADVLRLQYPHACIEVVVVRHRLEEPYHRGVPAAAGAARPRSG